MTQDNTLLFKDSALSRGFTQVPNSILEDTNISVKGRFLYSLLLKFAWQEGQCFPGQTKLGELCGVTRYTISKWMKELEDAGYIEVERRGQGNTNIYRLNISPHPYDDADVKCTQQQDVENKSHQDVSRSSHKEYSVELYTDEEYIPSDDEKESGYSDEVHSIVDYLKEQLEKHDTIYFPKMWKLKNCAIAKRILSTDKIDYDDLKDTIDAAISAPNWDVRGPNHMKSIEYYLNIKGLPRDGGSKRYKTFEQLEKEGKI